MSDSSVNLNNEPNSRFDGAKSRLKATRLGKSMQGDGLRAKAMRGSGWTIAGFGASQVLRLGSNLILTRLLFPEAFGLMALAQVFLQGLNMLSDIGVGPSIVQNKRGDDPDFLATAWTMQVIRGFTLCLGMCALAYPASKIYHEPLLIPILMLIGTTAVVTGFQSIGMATASRKMALGKLTAITLVSQSVGIAVMVGWAWGSPTVWALVAGGIASAITRVSLGHRALGSAGNRFHFERSAATDIFHFGKWIFLATAMTYFGGQGLRLVQGLFVPIETLGIIAVAFVLGKVPEKLTQSIGSAVIFPVFSKIYREHPDLMFEKLRSAKIKIFLATLPVYFILIVFGRSIIDVLYDERYMEAGSYLVLLATSSAIAAMRIPFGIVLISSGDTYGHALVRGFSSLARVLAIVVGFGVNGVIGMFVADIVAQCVVYPLESWRLHRIKMWGPVFDLFVMFGYIGLGAVSYLWCC